MIVTAIGACRKLVRVPGGIGVAIHLPCSGLRYSVSWGSFHLIVCTICDDWALPV